MTERCETCNGYGVIGILVPEDSSTSDPYAAWARKQCPTCHGTRKKKGQIAAMTDHFNKLTPAEAERLAMLAEEAGEVVQAVCKVLRHGYESYHPAAPNGPTNITQNIMHLRKEVTDFLAVLAMMAEDLGNFDGIDEAVAQKRRYSHHQEDKPA